MLKYGLAALAAIAIAGAGIAQSAGSTYQPGSNLPQRTAGQVAPNDSGTIAGSAGPNTSQRVQPRAARAKGAVPNRKKPAATGASKPPRAIGG